MTSSLSALRQSTLRRAVLEAVESRRLMAATLDANYGDGGAARYGDGVNDYASNDSVVLPNGQLLSVAQLYFPYGQVQLHRFNADGSADTSFGDSGTVNLDLGTGADNPLVLTSILADTDGSAYIAGRFDDPNLQNDPGFVAHVNADGTLDLNYGHSPVPGVAFFMPDQNTSTEAAHLALTGDGGVYVASTLTYLTGAKAAVTKLDSTGAPVQEYSNGGTAIFTIPGFGGNVGQIVNRGNSILLVGDTEKTVYTNTSGGLEAFDTSIFTAVIDATGTLTGAGDPGLDGANDGFGLTTLDYLKTYDVDGVSVTADGGIVVGGNLQARNDGSGALDITPVFARFDASYAPVSSFGNNGVAVIDLGGKTWFADGDETNARVYADAAGNVYAAMVENVNPDLAQLNLAVIGLNASGQLDPNFGSGGVYRYNPSSFDEGGAAVGQNIAVGMDGSIYVTGYAYTPESGPNGVILKFGDTIVTPPVNHAPTVDSLSASTTTPQSGEEVNFTASFSDVDAGDALIYSWNFGDGSPVVEVAATSPTTSAAHTYAAAGDYTVIFTVRDASNAEGTETLTMTVHAPPPVNHAPTVSSVTGPATRQTNQSATFTATFGDVDANDALQVTWDFGDGSSIALSPDDAPTATASHTYATAGTFIVTFTVQDAAGATATKTTTITVTNPPPPPVPYTLVNGQLAYTGTAGNDTITLTKNSSGQAVLTTNGTAYVVPGTVSSVVLNGGAGNDLIKVSTAFTIPATLTGGDGNDTLRGGSGTDVVLGDAGNDSLIGRNGRDILVGGVGADLIIGNEQDDILISGTTSYASNNYTAYSAIQAEWTSNRPWALRVLNLSGLIPPPGFTRANGSYYLTPGVNVFDDTNIDTLAGGAGDDLPLYTLVGANRDVYDDGRTNFGATINALISGD